MKNKKYLIIDSRPYGLFSIFLHTIDCIKWAEDNDYIPYIRWNSGRVDCNFQREGSREASLKGDPKYVIDKHNFITKNKIENNSRPCLYADKEEDNVWDYYFERINNINEDEIYKNEYKINDIFMCGELDFNLENKFLIRNIHSYDALKLWSITGTQKELEHRLEVSNLIKKYIKIKQSVLEKVIEFKKNKMNEEILIGVHVRGTDKKTEYPFKQIEIQDYVDKIKDIIEKNNKKYKIYIASDNNEAIIKISEIFGKEKIAAFPSTRMQKFYGPTPICLSDKINKKKHGEETLIEMLLLAECEYIIGTDSNLTAAASYFNPNSKLIFLNRAGGR